MAEIVCYICIFHLTWLMSLHYLVKGGCSKFLPNTGSVTIRLLRFDVKVKRAYCRDNFLAQSPLPDMRRLSGDNFYVSTAWHLGASARDTVALLERKREMQETCRRLFFFNMADGISTPCNVAWGSGIMTVNSPSGSTLQCDMWLLDDMPLNSPVAAPCNVAGGCGMTCHGIRLTVRHIGILHLVSILTISP